MAATLVSTIWIEALRAQRPLVFADVQQRLPELPRQMIDNALSGAFRHGYFERTGRRHSYAYSVTPRCTVPPGVPIYEVLEAVA